MRIEKESCAISEIARSDPKGNKQWTRQINEVNPCGVLQRCRTMYMLQSLSFPLVAEKLLRMDQNRIFLSSTMSNNGDRIPLIQMP